jgi:hypothetical protein
MRLLAWLVPEMPIALAVMVCGHMVAVTVLLYLIING